MAANKPVKREEGVGDKTSASFLFPNSPHLLKQFAQNQLCGLSQNLCVLHGLYGESLDFLAFEESNGRYQKQ